jgi:hypothetical protein
VNATGYFLRADGANRDIGSLQDDENKSHSHKMFAPSSTNTQSNANIIPNNKNGSVTYRNDWGSWSYIMIRSDNDATPDSGRTSSDGGSEARPKNLNAGYIYVFIGF